MNDTDSSSVPLFTLIAALVQECEDIDTDAFGLCSSVLIVVFSSSALICRRTSNFSNILKLFVAYGLRIILTAYTFGMVCRHLSSLVKIVEDLQGNTSWYISAHVDDWSHTWPPHRYSFSCLATIVSFRVYISGLSSGYGLYKPGAICVSSYLGIFAHLTCDLVLLAL